MGFKKAVKLNAKLRLALIGPAGSGKTFTALNIAQHLGKRIGVVDTEHGSASKYADLFNFDVMELESYSPDTYTRAINDAQAAGYDILIIDSLSHAWSGKDGALELVDRAKMKSGTNNSFTSWGKVTPLHNQMVDTILAAKLHIICTMRSKMEYVIEVINGKSVPRKIGLQPIQRDGVEFEFDVVADMDMDNTLAVGKTRCPKLRGAVIPTPGIEIAQTLLEWCTSGKEPSQEPAKPEPAKKANVTPAATNGDAFNRMDKLKTVHHRLKGRNLTWVSALHKVLGIEVADSFIEPSSESALDQLNLTDDQVQKLYINVKPPEKAKTA